MAGFYHDRGGEKQAFCEHPRAERYQVLTESMTERAYLDWNATAPLRPEARAADAGRAWR